MPNIKSAIKRVEVTERNRLRNRAWKSAVRTVRTQVIDFVKTADSKKASEALKAAYETIDKAVSKGILHRNSAARKKSALAKQVFGLATAAPPTKSTAKKK